MKLVRELGRRAASAGSAMAFWPERDYASYLPEGTHQVRIASYWNAVGKHLQNALSRDEFEQTAARQRVSFQGPLPPAEQLNAYDEKTRNKIVQMAVDEQAHAHLINNKGLEGAIEKDKLGQRYGLSIAIVGLIAATIISPFSASAAAIIATLDLVGMVTVFVAPRILESRRHPDGTRSSEEN